LQPPKRPHPEKKGDHTSDTHHDSVVKVQRPVKGDKKPGGHVSASTWGGRQACIIIAQRQSVCYVYLARRVRRECFEQRPV
jgi:hypothetical protein